MVLGLENRHRERGRALKSRSRESGMMDVLCEFRRVRDIIEQTNTLRMWTSGCMVGEKPGCSGLYVFPLQDDQFISRLSNSFA